jgi:enolase 1/2/3
MHFKNQNSNEKPLSGKELAEYYVNLIGNYPSTLSTLIVVISIEDPFDQDDFDSWSLLRKKVPLNVQIVGDDLTVTNPSRIKAAQKINACNCLLLKVNQIGTLSEAISR